MVLLLPAVPDFELSVAWRLPLSFLYFEPPVFLPFLSPELPGALRFPPPTYLHFVGSDGTLHFDSDSLETSPLQLTPDFEIFRRYQLFPDSEMSEILPQQLSLKLCLALCSGLTAVSWDEPASVENSEDDIRLQSSF